MITVVAQTTTESQFYILVAILVGIFGILGLFVKGLWTLMGGVFQQLEATRSNTEAIKNLTERMAKVEAKQEALLNA